MKSFRKIIKLIFEVAAFSITLVLFVLVIVPYSRIDGIIRRNRRINPRIAWGTLANINIKYGSNAVKLYGYESKTFVYYVYHINQTNDFDFVLSKLILPNNILNRLIYSILAPYIIFLYVVVNYDIFHFYFDSGFFNSYMLGHWFELPLLRLAGKIIIVTPYGSDARLERKAIIHKYNFCMDCTSATKTCDEKIISKNLDYYGKYADVMMGCADLVDTLPRHDDMWFYPIDLSEWQPPESINNKNENITIVHASNHRKYKGTRFLIAAVEELKQEGYPVELILVERMLNDEAKEIYRKADIIADQFIGGAYALFAIEAMALGKPVLCFLRDDLYRFHPEWKECPIVNTNPDNIKEQLKTLINDKGLRLKLCYQGIEYVKKYHSLESVGARLDKLYKNIWK